MDTKFLAQIKKRLPWIAAAAALGGTGFLIGQALGGFPVNIAKFMGSQIVRQGGYNESLAGIIGYTVHFAVATSYVTLYALAVSLAPLPKQRTPRWIATAGVALLFAWFSTLATAPAIAITISVLSGQGFPASIPGLNTSLGFAFWNHLAFFSIAWLVTVVVPATLESRSTAVVPNSASSLA